MTTIRPLPERVADLVLPAPSGCWEWLGFRDRDHYGMSTYPRPKVNGEQMAHRVVWTLLVGQIPAGLQLDHLCRNRSCVNPLHLEPVTHRENCLRGRGFAGMQARQTHCKSGHPFDSVNTYRTPSNPRRRYCIACRLNREQIKRTQSAQLKAAS